MLVNMNHVLRYAEEKQCCIGAFDTPNLEILMAVIRAAEKREEPVIIQHAQLHECEMPIHIIGPIMVRMAKEARVPVCVMLDHGASEYRKEFKKPRQIISFSNTLRYASNVQSLILKLNPWLFKTVGSIKDASTT